MNYELFEASLSAVVRGFYPILREIDEILDDTNS
jgi:hypothetical protein